MSENLDKNLESQEPIDDTPVTEDIETEESTVFSAPAEHKDKAPKANRGNKKRLMSIISACLAVTVLVVGTVLVIKYIPKMTEGESPTSSLVFDNITLLDEDTDAFKTVIVTNENGEFKFEKKQHTVTGEDGQTSVTEYWTVNDVDYKKLSSVTVENKAVAAGDFVATRQIDQLSESDCGLDKPKMKIAIGTGSKAITLIVGKKSPDNRGSYVKLEGDVAADIAGKIYLVNQSYFDNFNFTLTDLADVSPIPQTMFEVDTSENKAPDGSTYAYFDSFKISGKEFGELVTVVNNQGESVTASLMPYLTTTPSERYVHSENLSPFLNMFSNDLYVAGCYAFEVNDKTIKEFGLDDPDYAMTLTIKGEEKTFKFALVDEQYAAVLYDGATMIRKIDVSNLKFLGLKTENLYMPNMFLYSIYDVSNLSFKNATQSYSFNISYDEDSDGVKTLYIKSGGKDVVTEDFQLFYERLVTVECSNFELEEITAPADSTITFSFTDGTSSVIEFYNVSATEYQYSINGKQMGRIPASYYTASVADAFANISK